MPSVYAKTGTIPPNAPWIFTGARERFTGAFEVDKPPTAGSVCHGKASASPITDSAATDSAVLFVVEVTDVPLSGAVAAGDLLSVRTDHTFEKRVGLTAAVGQALAASSGDAVLAALFLQPFRQESTSVGSTSSPTYSGGTFADVPEMSRTLTLRNGSGMTLVSHLGMELQAGDDVEIAVFLVDSSAAETQIDSLRARVSQPAGGGTRHERVPISAQIRPTEITGPTPHTLKVRWRALAGSCRAVDVQRRLTVAEL